MEQATEEVGVDIDMTEILKRIPHRYPFLLIDRAENYRPFTSVVGIKCVTMNEPFFPGHFPDNPVMPGVLILEAIAQTGALLMSKSLNADISNKTIMIVSSDNVRFRKAVRPGDVLRMQVEVLRHRGDLFRFKGQAFVGATLATETEFAAMVVEQR